jgi:phospholipase/carboxylesterase
VSGFVAHSESGHADKPVWLLLHGTGGDEHDLVPLAKTIAPDWGILSLRGRVVQNGQNRFFKRFDDGAFDMDDMAQQTEALSAFVTAHKTERPLIALGYSNGANMIASLLLRGYNVLDGAVLLRPTLPFTPDKLPQLDLDVLILSGLLDDVTPAQYAEKLAALLTKTGAKVEYQPRPTTHGLNDKDVIRTREWLDRIGR